MAYKISNLRNQQPVSGRKYFFDAHVWIWYFNYTSLEPKQMKYVKFLETILDSDLEKPPKVVVTSLLISEVINRLIRTFDYQAFIKETGDTAAYKTTDSEYYKQVYRKSQAYRLDYETRCNDFTKELQRNFEIHNEDCTSFYPSELFNCSSFELDFNDNVYYQIAKKDNLNIVTHDLDFFQPDVFIITLHTLMLEKGNTENMRAQGTLPSMN